MQIRALVCRRVWSAALLGSLLVGCGSETGGNPEATEATTEASEGKVVFSALPADDALAGSESDSGQQVHAAAGCPGTTVRWWQQRSAWLSNPYTAGTYSCEATVYATPNGYSTSLTANSPERTGSIQLYCNNGTWQHSGLSCDGKIVSTAAANGTTTLCSHPDPVRSKWISWYLADLKRCADYDGLEWWVYQYNNNTACHAHNNYDGYGSKDVCWRAQFRAGSEDDEALSTGHIASSAEFNLCGPRAAYPWSSVSAYGTQCKYRP